MADASSFIGRSPDQLDLTERAVLRGRWMRIEAVGTNAAECASDLRRRGLNPMEFEFKLYRGVSINRALSC